VVELDPRAFQGSWHVRRRITDAATGWVSRFQGRARITPTLFHEEGTIRFRDQSFPAERRFFIALSAAPRQQVTHHCGDDLYQGRFLFSGDAWVEIWDVSGPRKTYRSISHYARLPAPESAG
jgi:hypothetical protein